VRSAIEERGHQLEVTLPREPISVNADPGRLEQVLKNLLNNAAKYTDPGGRIWLTTSRRSVKARGWKSNAADFAQCEQFVNDVIKEFGPGQDRSWTDQEHNYVILREPKNLRA